MALFLLVTRFLSCFIDLVITSCLNKGRQDNVVWDIKTVVFFATGLLLLLLLLAMFVIY